jgi:hypothetical protein
VDETTRDQGGDLGWLTRGSGQVPPEVEEAAFSGTPGLVQGPLMVGDSYYLVQTLDYQDAQPVSPEVQAELREAEFSALMAGRRSEADVILFVELYDGMEQSDTGAATTPPVIPVTGASLPIPMWLVMVGSGLAFLLAGVVLRDLSTEPQG